jgi:hypothetical protein
MYIKLRYKWNSTILVAQQKTTTDRAIALNRRFSIILLFFFRVTLFELHILNAPSQSWTIFSQKQNFACLSLLCPSPRTEETHQEAQA